MKSLKINFLFVFFAFLNFANSNLPNGAFCYLKDGTSGICVEISGCPTIKNLLQRRIINRSQITMCNVPKRFLCCPSQLVAEETTIKSVFPNANQGERISARSKQSYD